jgi:hypothetical protein
MPQISDEMKFRNYGRESLMEMQERELLPEIFEFE